MIGASPRLQHRLRVLIPIIALLAAGALPAQTLFKYQTPDGRWTYSDRWPSAVEGNAGLPETLAAAQSAVRLREGADAAGNAVLVADNELEAWVQLAYRVEAARNLDPASRMAGNQLLPPRSQTQLMELLPIDSASSAEVSFSYQFIYGHPGARHQPEQPYRLPYRVASAHLVSQAYPDIVTHTNLANRHAVDFEMPIGTAVHAAREGVVIEIADGFLGAGLDLERDAQRANYVRILHADGTLALYGHLSRDSIRVEPGQQVARGELIADSGNSGFSSGPHLHFVVQRNAGGETESVPVQFSGAGETAITATTGERPVAH